MNKKPIFISIFGILIFSLAFGYSLVFAGTGVFDTTTKITFKLSDNVYLDSLKLNNTKILFKSGDDLSEYKIKSKCNIFSDLIYSNGDYYMYELKFFDNECSSENFVLANDKSDIKIQFNLNLLSEYDILSKMLDLKTTRLIQFKEILDKKVSLYSKYIEYDEKIEKNYYIFLEKNRLLNEAIYNRNIINNIIKKRDEKYIVPVVGYDMPKTAVKIPNSGRGYRGDYTDGIHHGWDIDGDFGEQVVALDEGIIVRVVSDFDYSNLNTIKRGDNLSEDDKIRNLDILRGKQVWLKTMSGDVVMYAHLNDIFTNIKVGEVVRKKQPLGTIGISGVPDKNYKDYHLHFVVHKNPFDSEKVGNYDIDDYMRWDWLFKGDTVNYIVDNQGEYFENRDGDKLTLLDEKKETLR